MSEEEVGKLNKTKVVKKDYPQVDKWLKDLENNPFKSERVINQRVSIPSEKIDEAIRFWAPLYVEVTTEGRRLNGAEAYELGDEKLRNKPNKVPYIAMCNLMVLEALKMMGENWPTVENPEELVHATDREKAVADYWKKNYAPTLFQSKWAWTTMLAVQAGEPNATRDILYNFKDQL